MCRLMTTQLEEALKGFPLYSQDGKGKDAICRAIFLRSVVCGGSSLKVKKRRKRHHSVRYRHRTDGG